MSRNACLKDDVIARLQRREAYEARLAASVPQALPMGRVDGEVIRLADGLAIDMSEIELEHVGVDGAVVKETARTYRVQTPVEWLVARGLVSQDQARAGRKLHEVYALGVCGARNAERGVGNGRKEFGLSDAQLLALLDYRKVMTWLSPAQRGVLIRVCCWDMPVRVVAQRCRVSKARVMELLRDGLDLVHDYFP